MLNPNDIRLCGLMLRRAGFPLNDIEIQLGIEHVQQRKMPTAPWHLVLAELLDNLYNQVER